MYCQRTKLDRVVDLRIVKKVWEDGVTAMRLAGLLRLMVCFQARLFHQD